MAIKTIAAGSSNGKVYRSELTVMNSTISTQSNYWGVSYSNTIDGTKPRGSEYDTIKSGSQSVFTKAKQSGATMKVGDVTVSGYSSYNRGSLLSYSDIDYISGSVSLVGTVIDSGLATFMNTVTKPCPCQGTCNGDTPPCPCQGTCDSHSCSTHGCSQYSDCPCHQGCYTHYKDCCHGETYGHGDATCVPHACKCHGTCHSYCFCDTDDCPEDGGCPSYGGCPSHKSCPEHTCSCDKYVCT